MYFHNNLYSVTDKLAVIAVLSIVNQKQTCLIIMVFLESIIYGWLKHERDMKKGQNNERPTTQQC